MSGPSRPRLALGIAGALLLVLTACAGVLAVMVRDWLRTPVDVADEGGTILVIAPGESFSLTARRLAERGILRHPRWLTLLARQRGDAVRIQAGEYRLTDDLTPIALLEKLVAGDVVLHSVTLVEGWTVREALQAIRSHERIRATSDTETPARLRDAMGVVAGTPPCDGPCTWADLEGQLFPDTYRFPAGTTDVALLRQARHALARVLDEVWAGRAEGLPFDGAYEALVLASIVEKETALPAERARIAGVFVRRLQRGMRLQSDPTVIYGVGDAYDGDITRRHLRTDTPYNTYTRRGLPPTPIAIAGRGAIEAAVRPAPGTALYFVATGEGDGSHTFSDTLEEHSAAVRRYLDRSSDRRRR